MTVKSFKLDIYDCKVNVVFSDKWQSIAKKIADKNKFNGDGYFNNISKYSALAVRCVEFTKTDCLREYYMFFPKKTNISTISHECIHIMLFISLDYDLDYDMNNQEAFAYLGSYLISKTVELYTKRGKK